jgi:hypothetical protein
MMVDPIFVEWGLGILGTVILTGIGYILKTLGNQNQALAVLVERVGPAVNNIGRTDQMAVDLVALKAEIADNKRSHEELKNLVTDNFGRIWGIYDAWKGPASPNV